MLAYFPLFILFSPRREITRILSASPARASHASPSIFRFRIVPSPCTFASPTKLRCHLCTYPTLLPTTVAALPAHAPTIRVEPPPRRSIPLYESHTEMLAVHPPPAALFNYRAEGEACKCVHSLSTWRGKATCDLRR